MQVRRPADIGIKSGDLIHREPIFQVSRLEISARLQRALIEHLHQQLLLKKLLQKNQSTRQLWGAAIGAFLGLFLLLAAIQFWYDLRSLTQGNDRDRFVQINKKVSIFNTLGVNSGFTQAEIDTLLQQPFVTAIGQFTPNKFKVSASSSMLGFYTELFFEAIDDDFLDIHPKKFSWKEGQNEIPVIISRDYLALYNFGFAPSQGLPQFTQNTIKKVSVDVTLQGRGQRQVFKGNIVGFSDRINSILIPKSLMDWANKKFGSTTESSISRLILATDNPYSLALQQFLKANNYEVSTGKLIGGQLGLVLNIILGILAFIGLVITLLSILVFTLNFELIISRSSQDIDLLLQLGYRPKQISDLLVKQLALLFGAVLVLALVTLIVAHFGLSKWLASQSFPLEGMVHWSVILVALLLGIFFLFGNKLLIEKRVRGLFR